MKKIVLICLLVLSVLPLRADEVDIEKPDDAFATWTDVIIRKDYNNWHIGGLIEYCTIDKGQGLKSNEFTVRPIMGYNPLPWLRLQFQIDFLHSLYGDTQFYIRYIPDVTFHWAASDFRFSVRNRIQMSQNVTKREYSSTAVRNRFKVDYLIPKAPVTVHLAAEPYWWGDGFIKTRYYLGADFKLNKQLSLTADYIRYQHYKPDAPDQNVVVLALNIRL